MHKIPCRWVRIVIYIRPCACDSLNLEVRTSKQTFSKGLENCYLFFFLLTSKFNISNVKNETKSKIAIREITLIIDLQVFLYISMHLSRIKEIDSLPVFIRYLFTYLSNKLLYTNVKSEFVIFCCFIVLVCLNNTIGTEILYCECIDKDARNFIKEKNENLRMICQLKINQEISTSQWSRGRNCHLQFNHRTVLSM